MEVGDRVCWHLPDPTRNWIGTVLEVRWDIVKAVKVRTYMVRWDGNSMASQVYYKDHELLPAKVTPKVWV